MTDAADRTVTLYGRPGCHLCEAAELDLRGMARELRIAIEIVNIEDDDAILAKYVFEIPVIVCRGREVAKGRIVAPVVREELRDVLGP